MWEYTGRFIKSFILTFLVLIIFINIVLCFNLYLHLGLPNWGESFNSWSDGSTHGQFFGISSFIDAFTTYYDNNYVQIAYTLVQKTMMEMMKVVSWSDVIDYKPFQNLPSQFDGALSVVKTILQVANLFLNVPYMVLTIIYFLFFLIYLLSLLVQFVIFVFYLLGSGFTHLRTDTYHIYSNLILQMI